MGLLDHPVSDFFLLSGLNLRDALNNCLQTWGIVRSKVGCLTTDNGGNIVLAGRLLRLPHMACFDHTLTIGVDSIYKLPVVDAVLAKCKKIQTLFSISTTARREFRNIVSVRTSLSSCER